MGTRIWDAPAFVAAVDEVLAERGDTFTYEPGGWFVDEEGITRNNTSCRYFEPDGEDPEHLTPGCLFGAAFDRLGFGPDDVVEESAVSTNLREIYGLSELFSPYEVKRVMAAANRAQSVQDAGRPYEEVRAAWRALLAGEPDPTVADES